MTKRNFKRMIVTLLAVMMFFTSVPSTAMAANVTVTHEVQEASDNVTIEVYNCYINGVERELNFHSSGKTKGQTILKVSGKDFILTNPLVAADARFDINGTVWIRYKNGAVYWWNYDLQKNETVAISHKSNSGIESFKIEENYVTGLNTSSGTVQGLLSVEEQKKVLGITSTQPTTPTNPTQPEQKPTNPTQQPTQSEQKPSQTSTQKKPSQATKKTTTVKAGKVIHKGRTYYVYNTKGKVMTKFSLTKKGGRFTWRGYPMKNVIYVGMIRKSKNIVVLTKKAAYKFNYSNMKRTKLYDVKKYGKPIKLEYDNDGFAIRVVTKKPRRFSIKNK